MASFVIMQPPEKDRVRDPTDIAIIRDGFAWLAAIFPLLWMLWHHLWIEALIVLALGAAAGLGIEYAGLDGVAIPAAILFSILVGLEAANIRVMALRRRGWRERAVVVAPTRSDAFARYLDQSGHGSVGIGERSNRSTPHKPSPRRPGDIDLFGLSER